MHVLKCGGCSINLDITKTGEGDLKVMLIITWEVLMLRANPGKENEFSAQFSNASIKIWLVGF